jgi:hypothetical protein
MKLGIGQIAGNAVDPRMRLINELGLGSRTVERLLSLLDGSK